jgi:hypothetical protein
MRKLVYAFGALVALSLFSCIESGTQNNSDDTATDSIAPAPDDQEPISVTGVAIDGAMNSISLLVGDDTVYFSYPDLDNDHRASWDINDSVTVHYYVTANGDSVTEVINQADA